jgi:anti-sigma factor RsiW
VTDAQGRLRSANIHPEFSADAHSNVGAYVVDALDAPERAEFRAHLESCESCRSEVVEFRETTAQLTSLVQASPPADLRGSVLSGIRKVRPLPPPEQPAPEVASVPNEVAPLDEHPSVMPWSLALGAAPTESPTSRSTSRDGRVNRVLLAVTIVALLVCLVLGGWVFVLLQ